MGMRRKPGATLKEKGSIAERDRMFGECHTYFMDESNYRHAVEWHLNGVDDHVIQMSP